MIASIFMHQLIAIPAVADAVALAALGDDLFADTARQGIVDVIGFRGGIARPLAFNAGEAVQAIILQGLQILGRAALNQIAGIVVAELCMSPETWTHNRRYW
ncbi:hypothetical protein [Nitrincola sp. MINF-07-Sa-05]|uniref:hypothetical protein n=1 Tax=Nitrincola salilacus TaxID=3400273 RepID=UPI003917B74C